MQYFKPEGARFVGDCMPFFHDGVFHLFYLLDEGHHQGRGGLGGHQWAHASTTDLIHWTHHPLALPASEEWEASICTGSVFHHVGAFHAFYATRMPDWTQHLSHAVSSDGIAFEKTLPNPFASPPPGYSAFDYRDPFVYADDMGRFQMLVTSKIENFPLQGRGGCLLRLSSDDLQTWQVEDPALIPSGDSGYACVPECPDRFVWNGWRYLLFGLGLKSCYRMSAPGDERWHRPAVDALGNGMLAVMKTAPFGENRRIGAAWIGSRKDDRDDGAMLWGGNLVLRELIQLPDGSLGTRFLPEVLPAIGAALSPELDFLTNGASGSPTRIQLDGPETLTVAALCGLPRSFRLRCRVEAGPGTPRFGLGLRGAGAYETFYPLAFSPHRRTVSLARESIECLDELDGPFELDLVLMDDIIDVCVGQRHCLINRLTELNGDRLFFFCEDGSAIFSEIEVTAWQTQ
jgi:hypothetical protein